MLFVNFEFAQINLLAISNVELTKWLRREYKLDLAQAFHMAKIVKEAHRLGVVRGQALK